MRLQCQDRTTDQRQPRCGILLVVVRVGSEQSTECPRPPVLLIFCAHFVAIPSAAARCWRVDENCMFRSQIRKRGGQDESTKRVADSKGGSRAAVRGSGRNDGRRRSLLHRKRELPANNSDGRFSEKNLAA